MDDVDRIFTKRVDTLGRVVVPADLRSREGIVPGGYVTLRYLKHGRKNESDPAADANP